MPKPDSAYPTTADAAEWWYLDPIAAELEKQSRIHRYHPPEVFDNVTRWLMHYFSDIGMTEDEAIMLVYNFSFQMDKTAPQSEPDTLLQYERGWEAR